MSFASDVDELLVGFCSVLRNASLPIGSDAALTFCTAAATLDASDLMSLYWSGRATLVRRPEHIPLFNMAFQAYFLDVVPGDEDVRKRVLRASSAPGAVLEIPNTEAGLPGEVSPDEVKLGFQASASEIYRHKAFADCTTDELRAMRALLGAMKVEPPVRRTFRRQASKQRATLDLRRMARAAMRELGEPGPLLYKKRKERLRPIVFILDVSGSMADYSRNLLQFAYAARRANARVEVYCFGTRLTRITRWLDRRDPDAALREAGEAVLDWDGGTRIGDSIQQFLHEARRSRLGRGAIVVICSDGLDRGEPAALAKAMEGLSRLAHRVLWVNPHRGDAVEYVPATMAMIVADQYIDEVHSGHNLASLEKFAARLSKVG